ncbi:MAG: leucyl aminopeptidase family protein [Ancalomicrobiaceae bacterium]|nr:leucyl aminopeptidase family protein [Ancalomicrobiaceae bacterium]
MPARLEALGAAAAAFVRASGFEAKFGQHCVVPGTEGLLAVLFGMPEPNEPQGLLVGKLPTVLPAGVYALGDGIADAGLAALAWGLGAYKFSRYKTSPAGEAAVLKLGAGLDRAGLVRTVEAVALARDLVNTPANDLGPADLAAAVRAALEPDGAEVSEIAGADLSAGFPLIHAVGQGSDRAPRLIEATWGQADHPKVTLVGKGVVFDTGGLDIKSDTGMLLMKKDMGGAANVLALSKLIIGARLPVRLRVLIPAVENAISGRAFRPSDIYPSRKGITVEIGNTDAEGRLVLADALAFADEEAPDLLIDMATLTGAARVALGPELPPFYSRDDALAARLQSIALDLADPLWRLPLWKPYEAMLDSKVADTNNAASGGFAGSITAALFLSKFVEKAKAWVHLDIYAWNPSAKPGRPEGGEAQGIRALFELIRERFGA